MTLVLAYVHYYTPNFLPGRCLPASALRRLATWIGMPDAELRSARAHPLLAAHLALAHAAGLVTVETGIWQLTVFTLDWLEADAAFQAERLLTSMRNKEVWADTLSILSLEKVFGIDVLAYVRQHVRRWSGGAPMEAKAKWLSAETEPVWRLTLPPELAPSLVFHLLQMGTWERNSAWKGTGYSLGVAAQRGYSLTMMEFVLQQATGSPLSVERQRMLLAWYRNHDAVQIRSVFLLTVKEEAKLAEIMSGRRMREHVQTQLSPRHAIVSSQIVSSLRRKLKKQDIALDAPQIDRSSDDTTVDREMAWLGLRLLVGLGKQLPLPTPSPHGSLSRLASQLTPVQLADLEQKAEALLRTIGDALRGKDAFFPMREPVDEVTLAVVKKALADNRLLAISYQGLGDAMPRYRRVAPLRLEARRDLYYLHAYCYLAEANRVFRLYRILHCDLLS